MSSPRATTVHGFGRVLSDDGVEEIDTVVAYHNS